MKRNLKFSCFLVTTFLFSMCTLNAFEFDTMQAPMVIDNASNVHKVNFIDAIGEVNCISTNEAAFTVDDEGNITPVADGAGNIVCADQGRDPSLGGYSKVILIDINHTYSQVLIDAKDSLPTEVNVDYVFEFIQNTKDDVFTQGLPADYLQSAIEDLITEDDVRVSLGVTSTNTSVTFKLECVVDVIISGYTTHVTLTTEEITLTINYKDKVDAEANAISTSKAKIKHKYYAYINDIYGDVFSLTSEDSEEFIINSTSLKTDINNENITFIFRGGYGDSSLESPMIGGVILLKINGKIYDAKNVEFYKALKLPTISSNDKIPSIKKYFENYLIESNEKVDIEPIELPEGEFYKATISLKSSPSLSGFLSELLLPSLKADGEKVIVFALEESEGMILPNPKTNDDISLYIYIAIASFLFSVMFITNKIRKNN